MRARRWTIVLLSVSVAGAVASVCASEDSTDKHAPATPMASSQEVPSASSSNAPSLGEQAKQFIQVAKSRLEDQHTREREHAQQTAVTAARAKTTHAQARAHNTERQRQTAKEQQLKLLYAKGLELYRQGSYQEAIDVLQRLALIDPEHPLVKSADRMITRAELKQFEQYARAGAVLPPDAKGAAVPDLERLLTQKRMQLETVLKYAQSAAAKHEYDTASKLLTGLLVQDPNQHQAQQLLEHVQLAQLAEEGERTRKQVELDEHRMVNDVLKAQVLPPLPAAALSPASQLQMAQEAMSEKLRQPMTIQFTDVPLSDVLDFIAQTATISIIPSPRIDLKDRRVSINVKDLPLEQAIKYLAKSLSLGYRVEPDAVVIATPEEFSNQPMETRVFFLKSGLGPFALQTSAIQPDPALVMEPIKEVVTKSVPQPTGSRLVIDERSGALVATNTPDNLELIGRLLTQLDVTPLQVLIESRFIELTMTDLDQMKFASVLNGNLAFTKEGFGDKTQGDGHVLASGSGFKFPSLDRESEALNLTLQGVLTGTQFESLIHLLEENKKSKTLSAPRVTALNNQAATIKVVDEFRYPTRYEVSLVQFDITGDGDFNDAGETEFVNVPKDFQERDIGILLHVTPSVGRDLRTITLVMVPEVSQFSQFRDLGGGVTVPEFTSSQLSTSVIIENGQTVVLGGLMKDSTSDTISKVPVLGDIPVLGNLFRQHELSTTRKNLLIFITAHLLAPRGETT